MPLSPPFRPGSSPTSSTLTSTFSGPLPTLPFEIIRRIIYHRLAIPPSYTSPLEDQYESSWDSWSGVKGKQTAIKRLEERKDVTKSARGLMTVCKAWKPLVMKYLYSSPYITSNITSLASCILYGDTKWSDINLHEFSIPGRYITFFDLSTIPTGSIHSTDIRKACLSIFPLLPNVQHLKLPSKNELPFKLEEIGWAPFAKTLKCLEGLQVDSGFNENGKDGLIELLRKLPNLEILSVIGPSGYNRRHEGIEDEDEMQIDIGQPLNLPKLHTLKLEDIKNGNLLKSILQSELPNLQRLLITSFFGQPDDLTYNLQETHGSKIRSLTYLQGKSSPFSLTLGAGIDGLVPSRETLGLHPNLKHLAFLIPDYEQLNNIITQSRHSPHHPLSTITIYKWIQPTRSTSESDGQQQAVVNSSMVRDTNSFLRELSKDIPKSLKRINVDGFKWVKLELGKIALDAGTSGQMRKLSDLLLKNGLELGDMDGNFAPTTSLEGISNGNSGSERVYGPMIGGGRRRSSGGQSMIRMNIGMMMNGNRHSNNSIINPSSTGIERGSEEEDGG
ncbi:uncharacterized protein L201_005715 [Kwoniella dendrophila CBS 6074]|uniref:F-box domain-containing protein n=1 Tax=Kwoniella dendrophila CBS 6074 TaxID=1295534 RepID=A0AAX4K201_9TREE